METIKECSENSWVGKHDYWNINVMRWTQYQIKGSKSCQWTWKSNRHQSEEQRKKIEEKQSFRIMWNNIKLSSINLIESLPLKKKREKKGAKGEE